MPRPLGTPRRASGFPRPARQDHVRLLTAIRHSRTALGTLKNNNVFTPLFSAFGPEPIEARVSIARAKVLVTTDALYKKKIEGQRGALPSLEHVLLIGESGSVSKFTGTRDLRALLAGADNRFTIPATDPEDIDYPKLIRSTAPWRTSPRKQLRTPPASGQCAARC